MSKSNWIYLIQIFKRISSKEKLCIRFGNIVYSQNKIVIEQQNKIAFARQNKKVITRLNRIANIQTE